MWAAHEWKVYLDSEEAIENVMQYVDDKPIKEDKPKLAVRYTVRRLTAGRMDDVRRAEIRRRASLVERAR